MNCFKVERTDKISWVEDFAMVVIALDPLHAERLARQSSPNFKKAKLKVTEVNMEQEQVILIANSGA